MKKGILCIILLLLVLCGKSQIYEPDGVRIPGDWNSWTNNHNMGGDFDLVKQSGATIKWVTTFQYSGSSGSVAFKFTSGTANTYANEWRNTTFNLNAINNICFSGNSCPTNNNYVTVTNGKYYTVNWQDNGYNNTDAIIMETDNAPIAFDGTTPVFPASPTVYPMQDLQLTITLAGNKSTQEKAFVRYSDDGYTSSTVEEVSFSTSTSSGTVTIPGSFNTAGKTVSFYVYTTTASATSSSNHDLITLKLANNGGSNYSYTVQSSWTTSGSASNFNDIAAWDAGEVPPAGVPLTIEDNIILNQNYTAESITINSGATLTSESGQARELTIQSGGTLTNNGTFTANDGKVIFLGNNTVSGTVAFNDVDLNGGCNFGTTSTVNGNLSINNGGSVSTNAPTYTASSTLVYNSNDSYGRNTEWSSSSAGPGYPHNVTIKNGTTLDLGANSGTNTARQCSGNLLIESGATLSLGSMTASLTVSGNCTNSGAINLSSNSGGDLIVNGVLNSSGTFTANIGALTINSASIISGASTLNSVTLNNSCDFGSNCTVNGNLTINSGGSVATNTPTYSSLSTLIYNTGGTFNRNLEWSATAGVGYPHNVTIANNTTLDLSANSGTNIARQCGGNLLVESGSTLSLGSMTAGLTVKGTCTNNGLISLSSSLGGNLTVDGTFASSGTFTANNGDVTLNGFSTFSGTSTFSNVTLNDGCDFGTGSTVNGNLTLNSGSYVTINAPTYGASSTLIYNMGGAYGRNVEWGTTSGAGYPQNVKITNNTTLDLGANSGTNTARECAGNLTIDAGSTLSLNTSAMTQALTVKGSCINNGTIVLSSSIGGDLILEGDFTDNGTFTANGRAVFFEGGNTQTITSATNPLEIDVMRIGKSGGEVVMNQNLLVAETGDPFQTSTASSVLNLNGYTLTIGKTGVTSAVTMHASSSIKSSNSSSGLTILGNGDLGSLYFDATNHTIGNLEINRGSGSVTIETDINLAGTSSIANDNTLTIVGDLTNSGTVNISETGALVQGSSSNLTNTGTFNVSKVGFSGGVQQYNVWSSPVTAGNVSVLGGNRYFYNPANVTTALSEGWVIASGAMTVGRGYFATNSGNVTFSGTVNNGDITYTATAATLGSDKIMNLIGNPYPSGLNLTNFMANATNNSNLTGTLYFWDDNASAGSNYTTNGYSTWSGGTFVVASNGGGKNATGETAAASAQGFIVIPQSGVADGSFNIEFTNSMREGNSTVFFKQDFQRLWINLQDDSIFMSQTAVVLNDQATNGYDETFDAPRIAKPNSPLINCKVDTVNCAIGTYQPPFEGENTLVQLQLWVPTGKEYTLAFSEFEGLEDYNIYLVNDWEGTITPLSSLNEVQVNLQQGNNEQLYLVFKAGATVGVEEAHENKLSYSSTNDQLVVFGLEENTTITILNLNGQVVQTATTTNGMVNTSALAGGIYLARVSNCILNETIKFYKN